MQILIGILIYPHKHRRTACQRCKFFWLLAFVLGLWRLRSYRRSQNACCVLSNPTGLLTATSKSILYQRTRRTNIYYQFFMIGFLSPFSCASCQEYASLHPLYCPSSLSRLACKRNCTIINLKERGVKLFIRGKKGRGKPLRREKKVVTWVDVRVFRALKVSINIFGARSHSQSLYSWPQG